MESALSPRAESRLLWEESSPLPAALGMLLDPEGRAIGQALEGLRAAAGREPHDARLLHRLGLACHLLGAADEAEASYLKALGRDPASAEVSSCLGHLRLARERPDEAVTCYREALRHAPGRPGVRANLALALLAQGRAVEAVEELERAARDGPSSALVHTVLGLAHVRAGRLAEALGSFQQTLQSQPEDSQAHACLGLVYLLQDRPEEADAHFRQALDLSLHAPRPPRPRAAGREQQGDAVQAEQAAHAPAPATSPPARQAESLYQEGLQLARQGRLDEAVAAYRQVLTLNPDLVEAHNSLGIALADLGRPEGAAQSYREALRRRPDFPEAHNNLGIVLEDQGKLDEAVACFRESLRLKPGASETHSNLGVALAAQGKLDEAVACYHEALRLNPSSAQAHNNLGNAQRNLGQVDEAIASLRRALELKADYAEAYNNLGIALVQQGRLDEALAHYGQALRLNPAYVEAHTNRALAWLAAGTFEEGWAEYEWRWRGKGINPHTFPQPAWDGSPLAGRTILVYAEQGLGDTLQFIRYAPLLAREGARVLFECPPPLQALLRGCEGVERLLVPGEALPPFDVHCALLSLPRLFGTRLDSVPARVPYLQPESARVETWRRRLRFDGQEFLIAIAWQGNPKYRGDRHRSIPLAHFTPLARLPGVRLVSLQKGFGREQLQALAGRHDILDLGGELDEQGGAFVDTAAVMRVVDLVVTSDTAVAHLAGALGAPVWLALPLACDWRWLRRRDDSPWYPSLRLFRQHRWGDWDDVFRRIAAAVQERRGFPPVAVLSPAAAEARGLFQEASLLVKKGKPAEAILRFQQALRLEPGLPGAHHNLGVALARMGRLEEAVASFRQALQHNPAGADTYNNLGLAQLHQGQLTEAVASFRQALRLQPDASEAANNLGVALARQGKFAEAVDAYQLALRCRPGYADAHNNLGNALRQQGKLDEAVEQLRRAIDLKPDLAEPHNNLGIALDQQGKLDEAAGCFRVALRLNPQHADAWNNLGVTLGDLGRLDEALESLGRSVQLRPDHAETHKNRALLRLMTGNFAEGWEEYEWRWRDKGPRQFRQPAWDGSPLGGRTILVHAEQGLGDAIQFARYAALLERQGARVLFECPAALQPLLRSCPGIAQLLSPGAALPPFDLHCALLSLPRLFGTRLDNVPAAVPYLQAEPARVESWRRRLRNEGAFLVGIAWQGNPRYRGDRHRSIPLAHFAPLARLSGVRLVSLQKGPGCEQLAEWGPKFRIIDLGGELDEEGSFLDTAAVVKNLGLVVTSDTAVAHLAGALGAPVWLALPLACDWRWLRRRDDSPWYPSLRLFRQHRWGDWDDVFRRIAGELERLLPPVPGPIVIETSAGELIDKLTILEIKSERIAEEGKRANVLRELETLRGVYARLVTETEEVRRLKGELRVVNEALWRIEDDIRLCEHAGDFGPRFVGLARSVYQQNDHRAALKRALNELLGSRLKEEKAYPSCEQAAGQG